MLEPHHNQLAHETSPYLLQHKENPVHWWSWGEAAFAAAEAEQKPIFLSIGYSTCYWCHVMAHDSFEHDAVAAMLNERFISIKVDREERPDVDAFYMKAVHTLHGHGGWPMSVFLTPDRVPFYAGTFFWRAQFLSVLKQVAGLWRSTPERIAGAAEELLEALRREERRVVTPLGADLLNRALHQYQSNFDATCGGFGGAPKFPPAMTLSFLLRWSRGRGDRSLLSIINTTLDRMACGGIYDHLGGGFHRYATDVAWQIPHFEKMLYDNALLARSYLEAFQVTGAERYAVVARQTLTYLARDLQSPEGAFFAAEDAGTVGKEGEFYTWSTSELTAALGSLAYRQLGESFAISTEGNFEHRKNILCLRPGVEFISAHRSAAQALAQLKGRREERSRPDRDRKILTAWNGLALSALALGARVLAEESMYRDAVRCAEFLKSRLYLDGELYRSYAGGQTAVPAVLEDYAFLIAGLLELFHCDFDPRWLAWAQDLQEQQDALFADAERGGYFTHRAASLLPLREKEFQDGALPSGNSISALNLLRLHSHTSRHEFLERAVALFSEIPAHLVEYPSAMPVLLSALDEHASTPQQLAIVLPQGARLPAEVQRHLNQDFLPHLAIQVGPEASPLPLLRHKRLISNLPTFYLCQNQTCSEPTNTLPPLSPTPHVQGL